MRHIIPLHISTMVVDGPALSSSAVSGISTTTIGNWQAGTVIVVATGMSTSLVDSVSSVRDCLLSEGLSSVAPATSAFLQNRVYGSFIQTSLQDYEMMSEERLFTFLRVG